MAHYSKLRAIFIDTQPKAFEAGKKFWQSALNLTNKAENEIYCSMYHRHLEQVFIFQKLQSNETAARYHLDIETDDVDAEVSRLLALGAKKIDAIEDWIVMQAPGGHLFCVVPVESPNFPQNANRWQ